MCFRYKRETWNEDAGPAALSGLTDFEKTECLREITKSQGTANPLRFFPYCNDDITTWPRLVHLSSEVVKVHVKRVIQPSAWIQQRGFHESLVWVTLWVLFFQ